MSYRGDVGGCKVRFKHGRPGQRDQLRNSSEIRNLTMDFFHLHPVVNFSGTVKFGRQQPKIEGEIAI